MRLQRSIRNRVRRSRREAIEVDITSLLDILVILLVFLLKSYNSSGLVFNIEKDIKLPYSETKDISTAGIIVQVSPTKILVEDKVVLDDTDATRFSNQRTKRIIPLFNELSAKREEIKLTKMSIPNSKPFSGIVNFVIDKSIGYNYLKKLMYTAGEAGFFKFNFVLMGAEE